MTLRTGRFRPIWRPAFIAAAVAVLAACSSAPRKPTAVVEKKNRASEYTDYGNRAYTNGEYQGALVFFEQALAGNLSVDNQPGVVQSLNSIGKAHVALGNLDAAEEVFTRAARLAAGLADPSLQAQSAINLAEVLLAREQNESARDFLAASLSLEQALQGTRDLAVLYHALAVAEKRLGDLDSASRHAEAALGINTKLRASEEIASNYYLIASILSKRGDLEGAMAYAQKALETDKGVENSLGIAQDLMALGVIAGKLGRDTEAFAYFERAHGIYAALGGESGLRTVLPELIRTAESTGRNEEARAYRAELDGMGRR